MTSPKRRPPGRTEFLASAARAITPPSPSLSARRMKTTYLMLTTRVIDQNTREITPYTSPGVVSTALWSMENTVCTA
jgi:hypothetical protein